MTENKYFSLNLARFLKIFGKKYKKKCLNYMNTYKMYIKLLYNIMYTIKCVQKKNCEKRRLKEMKLRHLINELDSLKVRNGDEFYEKLLEYDFLVDIINPQTYDRLEQTQNISIYLDGITDEIKIIAYLKKGEDNNVSFN